MAPVQIFQWEHTPFSSTVMDSENAFLWEFHVRGSHAYHMIHRFHHCQWQAFYPEQPVFILGEHFARLGVRSEALPRECL